MYKTKISLIAAIDEERGLGKNNGLLFHLSKDLTRFKRITTGHPIIMGRKTFESNEISGKPLPNRLNIVISRDSKYNTNGAVIAFSLEEAIDIARKENVVEIFIIGGGQIFKEAILKADKLYLTIVHEKFQADTFFPEYSEFQKTVYKEEFVENGHRCTFIDLER